MRKIPYIIRVLTVAPLMALVMLLILYFHDAAFFGNTLHFALAIVFLVVFPLLAYPLQRFSPKYKDKGREGQRALAFVFAVSGYVLGCAAVLILPTPTNVLIIYVSYLLSGVIAIVLNRLLHFKASGHACGIVGPFLLLIYFGSAAGFVGFAVLAAAWAASIYMKRHTHAQLVAGGLIPFAALGLVAAALAALG
ncbi:MAG: hypothetical protein ACOX8N_07555 [Christensenellales bacterium]|jgi:hypothetical protein